ncbi:DUF881 domain-containing protein [Actinomyces sp. oral taxon 180]|uniref:DUF881 domain-containing protein n=1 Tax=Actinomyces sp. oral taxon 180 TaxID=651609 RepID=UPI0001F161FE|nr:DUF881 domain-containing protein [Actinomyces sp. oral taxon 180]EFU60950.1 membrane spanning protein DUF881 [Actinomyces sp. oral taxon 180 str. F0310]
MPGIRARHLIGVLAVTVASGLLFSVSALNERRHPAATSDLSTLVRTRQEQVRQLETEVSSLDAAIEGFSPAQSGTAAEDAFTAGSTRPVSGPGVQITLSDAPTGQVPAGATPDDLVIHQQDIEDTMNALWSGGAEAMTVQGVRVTDRTVIRCIGNVILVDGTSFSPPYVIQAIGDPAALHAAVASNPRMVNYQAYVAKYGLGWDMQTKDALSFAPATTSSTVNYATVEETNG